MADINQTGNIRLGADRCFLVRRFATSLCTVDCCCMIGEPRIPWTILTLVMCCFKERVDERYRIRDLDRPYGRMRR